VFCHRGQVRFLESYTFRVRTRFFLSGVVIIDSPSLITSNTRFVARWVSRLKITKFKKHIQSHPEQYILGFWLDKTRAPARVRACVTPISLTQCNRYERLVARSVFYAAPCNAGYEIFSERGGWKVSASDQVSMGSPKKCSAEPCLFSIR